MTGALFSAAMGDTDVDRYLARIGYSGLRTATSETLRALHRLHPQAIAFENLDPLLNRLPLRLDAMSLMEKLVDSQRGGYCFEQNLLFGQVLSSLGFDVAGLAARILWNQPNDVRTPRGHMLLKLCVDGEVYIADVGFGALTLTAPLLLSDGGEQDTPHERFRLTESGGLYRLDAMIGDGWRPVYRFDLQEQVRGDYEIASYYLSSHPDSHFRKTLIAARPFEGGRHALLDNRLTTYTLEGEPERRVLGSVSELREALASTFLIDVPEGCDAILATALAAAH